MAESKPKKPEEETKKLQQTEEVNPKISKVMDTLSKVLPTYLDAWGDTLTGGAINMRSGGPLIITGPTREVSPEHLELQARLQQKEAELATVKRDYLQSLAKKEQDHKQLEQRFKDVDKKYPSGEQTPCGAW